MYITLTCTFTRLVVYLHSGPVWCVNQGPVTLSDFSKFFPLVLIRFVQNLLSSEAPFPCMRHEASSLWWCADKPAFCPPCHKTDCYFVRPCKFYRHFVHEETRAEDLLSSCKDNIKVISDICFPRITKKKNRGWWRLYIQTNSFSFNL